MHEAQRVSYDHLSDCERVTMNVNELSTVHDATGAGEEDDSSD